MGKPRKLSGDAWQHQSPPTVAWHGSECFEAFCKALHRNSANYLTERVGRSSMELLDITRCLRLIPCEELCPTWRMHVDFRGLLIYC
jgi:hypothetical protein